MPYRTDAQIRLRHFAQLDFDAVANRIPVCFQHLLFELFEQRFVGANDISAVLSSKEFQVVF